jgi:ribonuclease P protein component
MLPKKNRNDRKNIEQIFKSGNFVNSPNLTFKFIKTHSSEKKMSFIVPKTVSKKAVVRNLLRRRGYVALKKHFNEFPSGILGVFIFGKKSAEIFWGKKNKIHNPILNLGNEVKIILNKI